jgi:hypothetical protein
VKLQITIDDFDFPRVKKLLTDLYGSPAKAVRMFIDSEFEKLGRAKLRPVAKGGDTRSKQARRKYQKRKKI